MRELIADWQIDNMCFAHKGTLLEGENTGDSISKRLENALFVCEPVLCVHEERWGK